MPSLATEIMSSLHGSNIWRNLRLPAGAKADLQGWNGEHPSLSHLASTHNSRPCIIDIGVWKGQSTLTLANALRNANIDGCVIAIDTFLGSPEHYIDPSYRSLMGRINGRPDLYETFLSNVIKQDLQNYIVPLPQTTKTAAKILKYIGLIATIIHVDAAHEYDEVLSDCNDYWDLLAPGGYMIGDDYVSVWPGVIRAAGEFSSKKEIPLSIEYPKWILQKPLTVK